MSSFAWRHKQRVLQENAARAISAALLRQDRDALAKMAVGDEEFKLLVVALDQTLDRIHEVPQGEARRELKKRALVEYLPAAESYIAAEADHQNPVLIWCMVWAFDLGDVATGLRLGEVAVARHLAMPAPFKSTYTVKAFLADAVHDWAAAEFKAERSVEPYFPQLFTLAMEWPLHDLVKAKYCKLAALIAERAGKHVDALELARTAEKLHSEKAQVTTLIRRLEKAIAIEEENQRHAAAGDGGK